MKRRKFGNKKIYADGQGFDSLGEFRRWEALRLLEKAGAISALQRQVAIPLVAGCKLAGAKRARPAIRLVVDFAYYDNARHCQVFEDFKGMETPVSLMKRHMAKALHGIDVEIVGARK